VKGGGKEGQGPWWGKAAKEDAAPAEEEKEEMEAWAAMEEIPTPAEASRPRAADAAATTAGQSPAQAEQGQAKPSTKLYDSGASSHMSPYSECFANYCTILLQTSRFSTQLAPGTSG